MSEKIRKINFSYTKEGGEESTRTVIAPKFIKESYNSFKELEKDQVNYVSGYEIEKEGLTEDEIKEYEECVYDYFSVAIPTMEEYLKDLGLDPQKVQQKSFKKERISNANVITE